MIPNPLAWYPVAPKRNATVVHPAIPRRSSGAAFFRSWASSDMGVYGIDYLAWVAGKLGTGLDPTTMEHCIEAVLRQRHLGPGSASSPCSRSVSSCWRSELPEQVSSRLSRCIDVIRHGGRRRVSAVPVLLVISALALLASLGLVGLRLMRAPSAPLAESARCDGSWSQPVGHGQTGISGQRHRGIRWTPDRGRLGRPQAELLSVTARVAVRCTRMRTSPDRTRPRSCHRSRSPRATEVTANGTVGIDPLPPASSVSSLNLTLYGVSVLGSSHLLLRGWARDAPPEGVHGRLVGCRS